MWLVICIGGCLMGAQTRQKVKKPRSDATNWPELAKKVNCPLLHIDWTETLAQCIIFPPCDQRYVMGRIRKGESTKNLQGLPKLQ